MESSVDAALGRVALVLRQIGAVWMAALTTVYGLSGQVDVPLVAVATTAVGVGWAVLAWLSGWMRRAAGHDWGLLAVDLGVTVAVIIVPALAGEASSYTGGYPFAALVVALAAAGRRGVVVATAVLSAATLVALGLVGRELSPVVLSNLLLYVLGAVALWLGVEVIRANERRARRAEAALAVAEERAATATHLHDSVLQTLALVQRRADDAGAVRSLARRQERELREWLFPPDPDEGAEHGQPRLLGPALEAHAEEVEERYGVAVRVVAVGQAARLALPADDAEGLCALVLAAREAMANAAAHAEVASVDVFAELEAGAVTAYVRDRGPGFDLAAVPADRQGLRGSIVGRVERAGGSATITTEPGRGTEVRISIPHDAGGAREP